MAFLHLKSLHCAKLDYVMLGPIDIDVCNVIAQNLQDFCSGLQSSPKLAGTQANFHVFVMFAEISR